MDRLEWDKFAHLFHSSWEPKMRYFIESPECWEIYEQLRKLTSRGKKIVPIYQQTFRAFLETPMTEIKATMVGLSPYHTMKDGKSLADGVLMSCSNTMHLAPSLEQFYKGMENELKTEIIKTPDLTYLCKEGVFMFNVSMTCELLKPGSHIKIWEPFTKYVLEEVVSVSNCPVVWLGKEAARFDRYLNPFQWRFKVSHPASAAYNHTTWNSEGVFGKVNLVCHDYSGYQVNWALEKAPF